MIDFNDIGASEKEKNILMILNYIAVSGDASSADIAAATGLSFATISRGINALKKAKIIIASRKEVTDMGRRPDIFSVNKKYGYLVDFYVDTRCIRGYLADFNGDILNMHQIEIDRDITPDMFAKKLAGCAKILALSKKIEYEKIIAASVAVPGIVDERNKIVKRIPNFKNFKNVNLFYIVERALNMPVIINNSAQLSAVGELIHNYQGCQNMIYMDFTTYSGIGAGIILDGKLFTGQTGCAGEVGDMLVDSRSLFAGYQEEEGCLEAMAGVGVLFERLDEAMKKGRAPILRELMHIEKKEALDLEIVEKAVLMQDLDVMDVFDEIMKMWAIAIVNTAILLDPELIIMGGVVNTGNDVVLARVRHYISKALYRTLNVTASNPRETAQVYGGIYMLKKYVMNNMLAQAIFGERGKRKV